MFSIKQLAACQMERTSNKLFTVNGIARGCSQRSEYGHILTFRQGSGWIERCCATTSGSALNDYCPARQRTAVLPPKTTGASSRPCYGSCAPVARGEIFRKNLGIGIEHLFASRASARRVSGSVSRLRCVVMPTWSKLAKSFLSFVHLACAFVWLA